MSIHTEQAVAPRGAPKMVHVGLPASLEPARGFSTTGTTPQRRLTYSSHLTPQGWARNSSRRSGAADRGARGLHPRILQRLAGAGSFISTGRLRILESGDRRQPSRKSTFSTSVREGNRGKLSHERQRASPQQHAAVTASARQAPSARMKGHCGDAAVMTAKIEHL